MATKVSTPMLQPDTQFGLVPSGAVMSFAMSAAPMGWLPCDGAAINRTTYAPLFSAIGYIHGGSGDSFNVPDLRGEFIRGWSAGKDVDSERTFGSSQADDFKSHRHIQGFVGINASGAYDVTQHAGGNVNQQSGFSGFNAPFTSNTGGNETRPRNIALLYCIKF